MTSKKKSLFPLSKSSLILFVFSLLAFLLLLNADPQDVVASPEGRMEILAIRTHHHVQLYSLR